MVSVPDMAKVRSGSADDLDSVMVIMVRAFAPCFGEAWTRSQCAGILPMHGVSLTIAERDGSAVGFALARAVADEAELLLLAVDPAAQGHGVGKALLDHFVAASQAIGATQIHLEVRDGNSAIRLYRDKGFQLVGRRRDYYKNLSGERYDALTMAITNNSA